MAKRGYTQITGYDRSKGGMQKASRYYAKRKTSALSRFKKQKGLSRKAVSNIRIGGFLGIELKYVDYTYEAALVTSASAAGGEADPATALALNAIAQGDTESTRDGKQVMCKSAFVTGVCTIPFQTAAAAGTQMTVPTVFIALVQDCQTNGAQLNSEDVFVNPGGTPMSASLLRNLQYTSRFKVLDSTQLTFQPFPIWNASATTADVVGQSMPFKLSWNGDMPTNYTGTTAVVGAIQDNSLHVVAFTNNVDNTPFLVYNSRVRFVG